MTDRALMTAEPPDLLPCGSALAVEAGAGSGQSGQYAQPVKAAGGLPSCRSAVATQYPAMSIAPDHAAVAFVPVAMAAKDWQVTPRRIRFLLTTGRLEGLQQANGYWLVRLPLPLHFRGKGDGFKTISGYGTGGGMRHLDSQARERQFMIGEKIGVLSCALKISASLLNPHGQRAGELTRYTLCVF